MIEELLYGKNFDSALAVQALEQEAERPKSRQELEVQLRHAEEMLVIRRARQNLLPFIQYVMPHPDHPEDLTKSRYVVKKHHRILTELFERIESGRRMRSATSVPPQFGKTEVLSRKGQAWAIGRNPSKHFILGTYSGDFAETHGAAVRDVMESERYNNVFPHVKLKKGSKSKSHMETTEGGSLTFVGRKEGTTGRPCDMFTIDDPLKDKSEADSEAIRRELHDWFDSVVFSRCHTLTPIQIVHTRWHQDDLIGRLTDPDHPRYDTELAALWKYLNLPAIIEDPRLAKALGMQMGETLWPEKFSLEHLMQAKRMNAHTFASLYMGNPTPPEGAMIKKANILTYKESELPAQLRYYAASDHAVTEKETLAKNDPDSTVLLTFGVGSNDHIWVLDCFWAEVATDVQVDRMLDFMLKRKPQLWFAGKDHISKSIGPFLRKRMKEKRYYSTMIRELTEQQDKVQKAQSFVGRISMNMIHFPAGAPWLASAISQMLKFPQASHDDFIDAMANLCRGLDIVTGASLPEQKTDVPKSGTFAWIKWASEQQANRGNFKVIQGGM